MQNELSIIHFLDTQVSLAPIPVSPFLRSTDSVLCRSEGIKW